MTTVLTLIAMLRYGGFIIVDSLIDKKQSGGIFPKLLKPICLHYL